MSDVDATLDLFAAPVPLQAPDADHVIMARIRRRLVEIGRAKRDAGDEPLVAADEVTDLSHTLASKKAIGQIFADQALFQCTGMTRKSMAPDRKKGRILIWRVIL